VIDIIGYSRLEGKDEGGTPRAARDHLISVQDYSGGSDAFRASRVVSPRRRFGRSTTLARVGSGRFLGRQACALGRLRNVLAELGTTEARSRWRGSAHARILSDLRLLRNYHKEIDPRSYRLFF
jgi:hypothetical protein